MDVKKCGSSHRYYNLQDFDLECDYNDADHYCKLFLKISWCSFDFYLKNCSILLFYVNKYCDILGFNDSESFPGNIVKLIRGCFCYWPRTKF